MLSLFLKISEYNLADDQQKRQTYIEYSMPYFTALYAYLLPVHTLHIPCNSAVSSSAHSTAQTSVAVIQCQPALNLS